MYFFTMALTRYKWEWIIACDIAVMSYCNSMGKCADNSGRRVLSVPLGMQWAHLGMQWAQLGMYLAHLGMQFAYLVTCRNWMKGVIPEEEEEPPAGQCSKQPLSWPPVRVTPSAFMLTAPVSITPPRLLTLKIRTSSASMWQSESCALSAAWDHKRQNSEKTCQIMVSWEWPSSNASTM